MMKISQKDENILKELLNKYMEIASLSVQREKMELWKKFNRHDLTRPMVMIDQLPWHELNYDGSLTCLVQDPFLRNVEDKLRKIIFQWNHFSVDMVVEPVLTIPFCASNTGYGMSGDGAEAFTDIRNDVISHEYQNQLETEDDIEKIKDMEIVFDKDTSEEWKDAMEHICQGIIPVRQAGGVDVRLQIWDVLAELMNVENVYLSLIDRPEFVHKILIRMTHSALSGIQQMNKLGLFDTSANICHCSGTYTDELLPDFGAGIGGDSRHAWSYAMAQVFTSVSPAITEEFEVPYMSQLASQFGMFYYGCCERLDDRLEIVQRIPNIQKISCSPWSDKRKFAAGLKKDIIMSNKPSPSYLASPSFDLETVSNDIKETCQIAREHEITVEFLLKDLSTVKNEPERLTAWANTVMNIVEEY